MPTIGTLSPRFGKAFIPVLTDISQVETAAIAEQNAVLEGVAIVLRSYIFATLTNAYGDIPYSGAIGGAGDNFTPSYDPQEAIYTDLLSELRRADACWPPGRAA